MPSFYSYILQTGEVIMDQIKISTYSKSKSSELSTIFEHGSILIEGKGEISCFKCSDESAVGLIGRIDGSRLESGDIKPLMSSDLESLLKNTPFNEVSNLLEGSFLAFKTSANEQIEITTDRYARYEAFYTDNNGCFTISNNLNYLEVQNSNLDQQSLLYTFAIYGGRPTSSDTIFSNVKRIGTGETLRIDNKNLKVKKSMFKPIETFDDLNSPKVKNQYLNHYADIFIDSIKLRSSDSLNVVYLSSGWDSSSILATLVHLHGAKKVRGVIGRMHYSKRSKVANKFEISRAMAIAEHFRIEVDIVDLDHYEKGAQYLEEALPIYKQYQFMNIVPMNWYIISKHIREKYGKDTNSFCGEISDGVHNLGFSQFASIFHKTQEFREYSDKMRSYLFGPTFMSSLENDKYQDDVVYKLFKDNMNSEDLSIFDNSSASNFLLSSFFLGSARFPGYGISNEPIMKEAGCNSFLERLSPRIKNISEVATARNLYSCYNHLYNSFHWQGSTVKGIEATAKHNEINTHLPFWDSRLQDFLSSTPETWGRGLDLNPTKFPLKWTLENRIDNYPFELQIGPHSYTYDVEHNFNHNSELIHHSSYTPIFKDILRTRNYQSDLDESLFDLNYVNQFVDSYLNGVELEGKERDYLFTLSLMQLIR
jgi:hypothetical protein